MSSILPGGFGLQPFLCKSLPPSDLRDGWKRWLRGLQNVLAAAKVTDATEKKNYLLALGGFELQDVFYDIPGADVVAEATIDPFEVAVDKLQSYFAPKHHDAFERYLFWSLAPETEEPIEKFLLRAQNQATKCKFGKTEIESQQISIIDKIVLWAPPELREKLLQKEDLTLDTVTKTVNAFQAVKYQSKKMLNKSEVEVHKLYSKPVVNRPINPSYLNCTRCGRSGHDWSDSKCPARNAKCNKCGNIGHFYRKCKTKDSRKRSFTSTGVSNEDNYGPKRSHTVRQIDDKDVEKYSVYNVNSSDELIWCEVGGVPVEMLIDSGSKYNLIDDKTWEGMRRNGIQVIRERMDDRKQFLAYGRYPLRLLNVFDADIVVKDRENVITQRGTFYVIENGQQPLLGKITAISMGLLVVGLPSTHTQPINKIIVKRGVFPKIKGIQIIIPIDLSVKPVQQAIRRCPIALTALMKEKLDELLELDIIEVVREASGWVSPLVPVLKDNGELRICVDMRRANSAIVRENHPLPTMDDLFARLGKAIYFSQLDFKNGFHQCELHPESRYITTFISPWGLYRYKRLVFGINCAPELFQKTIEHMLSECFNALNYIDDILVFGETEAEHDKALEKVLTVFKNRGVLLNNQKCKFKVKEVTFFGHKLSKNGIEPSTEKVEAIHRFRAPISKEELRSFLGLVTFVAKFVPDLATVNAPLRELVKGEVQFKWGEKQQQSFNKIKEIIGNVKALGYFVQTDKTLVVADASGVALGGVLIQFDKNQCPRIISFASKSLTDCEKRFSQTEKEALALVWAVERFKLYLLGIQFELETDHKPLEIIFGKNSKPCARIERWVLRLQAFNYKVVYRRGKANLADSLSRLPGDQIAKPFSEDSDSYIRSIVVALSSLNEDVDDKNFDSDVEASIMAIHRSAALDVQEIESASEADLELQEVKKSMESGIWKNELVKGYAPFKDEFGFTGNLILRNSKLIIPKIVRDRLLFLAHEGHPGESSMKSRLRERCWWPKMDVDIQKWVAKCKGCQLVSMPTRPEPMARKQLPYKAWTDLAMDFLGPLPSGESILVVIDYFSRYMEAKILPNQTAIATRTCLHEIFTRLGYPYSLTFDNAKQLLSSVISDYCNEHGITWNNTIPYWPQANGEVERQNRSLLKRLKIGNYLNGDWKEELLLFLQMYYTTPHSVTGKTPTELMFGRTIRSKIPSIQDIEFTPPPTEYRDRDKMLKTMGKEREDARRRAIPSEVSVGDTVLARNLRPGGKFKLNYNPERYIVMKRNGPCALIRNNESGQELERNVAHLKKIPQVDYPNSDPEDEEGFQGFNNDSIDALINISGNSNSESQQLDSADDVSDGLRKPDDVSDNLRRSRRQIKQPVRFQVGGTF